MQTEMVTGIRLGQRYNHVRFPKAMQLIVMIAIMEMHLFIPAPLRSVMAKTIIVMGLLTKGSIRTVMVIRYAKVTVMITMQVATRGLQRSVTTRTIIAMD